MMEQERIVFSGRVTNVRTVPTKTGRKMVTCLVADKKCKAFGDVATACEQLDQHQATITAKPSRYQEQDEYAVVSVRGLINGQEVSATDVRSVPSRRAMDSSQPDSSGKGQDIARSPQSIAVETFLRATESSES